MTLEITENEYLIKLDRTKFGLSFLRSLLKQVEVANPTEDDLFSSERHSRIKNDPAEPDYFGSLEDK
ncbi:hypothetical protein [Mucilaginibacter sp. KACC 22063]|uniref:hypothetical protein n=1 Tax=Mucilaginibacter sp. KACC 22063 TaxID=3025666 RepID=UPI0023668915|nr:hypothetical protein [Mucilaginibacter sp. KACC 22063]WDF54143.1 hypothetical protein PQ461_14450 [Mucilaginibacter sp. KACC 22063]